MSSSSLRRSKRGKSDSLKEGDNVEIVKNKGVLSGVLIRKLDERPSNPVWIVRFDNGMKDQAIPEKSFGRVVPTSTKPRGRPRSSNSDNSVSVTNSSDVDDKAGSISTSTTSIRLSSSKNGGKQKNSKKKSAKNKQKQQSQADVVVEGLNENMSQSKNGKISVNTEGEQHQQGAGINTRSSTKGKRNYASLYTTPATSTSKPPPKKSKKNAKEECVKVQYSRGTLFLYRGENPRAVFKWNY